MKTTQNVPKRLTMTAQNVPETVDIDFVSGGTFLKKKTTFFGRVDTVFLKDHKI